MMKDAEYLHLREHCRQMAIRANEEGDLSNVDYYTGIIRGLDYAFQDGTAKK
jgi:hypothetical protein